MRVRGMRMAELSARSGVPRETIHFYLREGLLPRPVKGGRTVAFYGPEHLERLRTIRRLRDEKYLPLAVIRRLLDSPAAAAERDLDVLAEVLHIAPDPEAGAREPRPSPASLEAARARGLLGEPRLGAGSAGADPAERRVLSVVEEVLALDPTARALTLDDLAACAESLTGLVAREAELFFDAAIRSADLEGAVAALRRGRAPVARFITAYRDLMLRRLIDDLLLSIDRGRDRVARAAPLPLSAAAEARLGVPERRAALERSITRADTDTRAGALAWHLFGCGAIAELARVPPDSAGARVLVAWAAYETGRRGESLQALADAVAAAPGLALGQILLGEAAIVQTLERRESGAGLLEAAVPALHRVAGADPGADPEPLGRLLGWFHRGRLEIALPSVLGRRRRGAEALRAALELARDPAQAGAGEPAAAARVRGNTALLLSRYEAGVGERARARALLDEAAAVDPQGPIGKAARAERAALDQS